MKKTYSVIGGAGTHLYVEEVGNEAGRPILFLHGFSQCRLAWNKQLDSDLARDLRLVALDLRGHGLSEMPRDAYGDSRVWADDIAAVINELQLERPILCGWSYGAVAICDYVGAYGEEHLGGIHFVSAISRLGESVIPFLGSDFLGCIPGFFSNDVQESAATLQTFLRLCTFGEPAPEDVYFFLGFNTIVPPYVREGLFNRNLTHDDVLAQLRRPVLITHGSDDRIVLPTMCEYHARLIPHAQVTWYASTGHAPFWEAPDRFNRELRQFAGTIA